MEGRCIEFERDLMRLKKMIADREREIRHLSIGIAEANKMVADYSLTQRGGSTACRDVRAKVEDAQQKYRSLATMADRLKGELESANQRADTAFKDFISPPAQGGAAKKRIQKTKSRRPTP